MGKPSVAYRSCKLDSASNIEPQTDKMKVLESGGGKTVYFKYFIFQLSEFRLECFHSQTDQISFAQNEKKKVCFPFSSSSCSVLCIADEIDMPKLEGKIEGKSVNRRKTDSIHRVIRYHSQRNVEYCAEYKPRSI